MSAQHILSGSDVAKIVTIAKATRERSRGEAYALIVACDRRLKQASEGTLVLAADVRLPMEAVIRVIWKIRKAALAQWKAAKAADEAAKVEAAEADFLAEYREALASEHLAELAEVEA